MQMRNILLMMLALLAVAVSSYGEEKKHLLTTHELGWMNNLEEAKATALKEKKPIILFLHSQRCFYCPKLIEEVFPQLEVQKFLNKNFIKLDLDVATGSDSIEEDTGDQAPERFIVSMTPAILFMGPKEEKLYRKGKKHMIIYGFWKPNELITWGKEALKRFEKLHGVTYAK